MAGSQGFSGMRLFTTGSTMPGQATWFDDPRTFPAWEHAQQLGIPGMHADDTAGFPQLRGLIERFPGVGSFSIISRGRNSSMGRRSPPTRSFSPSRAIRTSFSSSRRSTCRRRMGQGHAGNFLRQLIKAYGANRIAWGSNFPATEGTLKEILGKAQQALNFASAADREWFRQDRAGALSEFEIGVAPSPILRDARLRCASACFSGSG